MPERRGACVRSSFLQLPCQDLGFLSSVTPALHSLLLPSSLCQPPSWPPPGARSPPLCPTPPTLIYPSGRSEGFLEQQVRMGGPKVCLPLGSPLLTVLLASVCPYLGCKSQVERGPPAASPNPQSPAQSHHPGYSSDGWMKPHDELVAWLETRSPSRASV